jgi:hypothetical protein
MTAFNAPISAAHPNQPQRRLEDYGRLALLAAGAAAVLMLIGLFTNYPQFFRAYLTAYMLWLGVTLGCMAFVMLHHLVGGGWGMLTRRICEAAMARFCSCRSSLEFTSFIPGPTRLRSRWTRSCRTRRST